MADSRTPKCQAVSDESLTDARKIRDLLAGVAVMRSPHLIRGTVLEAQAIATDLVERLEQFFAVAANRTCG